MEVQRRHSVVEALRHRPGAVVAVLLVLTIAGAAAGLAIPRAVAPARAAEAPAPDGPAAALPGAADAIPAEEEAADASAAAAPARLLVRIETEGAIERGQTLVGSLASNGVGGVVAHVIHTEMAPVFDFRYARPGDQYRVVQDESGSLVRFEYARSVVERYTLRRTGQDTWVATRHEPELVRRRARIAGVVAGTLYDGVAALGESAELAHDFAEIFAWDVDFSRAQPGDEFAMLYERLYVRDDQRRLAYVRPGRILAARYTDTVDDYQAVYYEREEGQGGYYRPDGSSVERQFLKAPLNYRRISSRYSLNRLHPILKVRRPHQGIDYAAATGTPVWSIGDGRVTHVGWHGGLGKVVKVAHPNGYVSMYGHLSRYADGLRVGDRIRQKEVVGYVGSTGLSTGPHLDFRLLRYGAYVNPATIDTPEGQPIPATAVADFQVVSGSLLHELDPASLTVVTNEAL